VIDSPLPGIPALPAAITAPRFPPTSRYTDVPMVVHVGADSWETPHLARRLLPDPGSLAQAGVHVVQEGERLDTIAAAVFGEPLLSWRLLDGNRALHPAELLVPGRALRVPLPAGVSEVRLA
jgi:hypothetical protein